jgi:hypothetical protein
MGYAVLSSRCGRSVQTRRDNLSFGSLGHEEEEETHMVLILPVVGAFVVGALTGRAIVKRSGTGEPGGGGILRPVVKSAIKVGAVATYKVKSFAAGVKEDFQDVAAEALSEMISGPSQSDKSADTNTADKKQPN